MQLTFNSISLEVEANKYSEYAGAIYSALNKEEFEEFNTLDIFKPVLEQIFFAHQQFPKVEYSKSNKPIFTKNNKVLLCYSGGLDSTYQALKLRELGFDVTLMHLKNANWYTNGQEAKLANEFAKSFNFKTYCPKISPKRGSKNKKFWQENSFKNSLIYTLAIDYMLENDIGNLSSGDDLHLDVEHSSLGVNTGDAKEITLAYMNAFGVNFIPIDSKVTKLDRLNFLTKYDARKYCISCVGPGRLLRLMHDRNEKKYNVHLDLWNCGSCRKCCMHILLDKYFNNAQISEDFESHCWKKLAQGADQVFFDQSLPLETRIDNLLNY